jgi:hypothetical protein
MAADAKKEAKMVHRDKGDDTGRKRPIPCSCGGLMAWAKVNGKMRYVCDACSHVLPA